MSDTQELILNAASYGLEPTKAEQIEAVFKPVHAQFRELDAEYKVILSVKEVTPELCEQASTLRKRYVKIRTAADAAHKGAKANILIEGKAIDGLKNIITSMTAENEENLRAIEEHFERIEQERLAALLGKRTEEISATGSDPTLYNLAEMPDDVYTNLLETLTRNRQEELEKAAKWQKEQDEKAAAEKAENERIRKENEELKKANEERDAILAKEKAAADAKAAEEKKAADEKLRVEREARERAEAELKAKEEKEAAELAAKQKAEAKAKRAPDKKKLEDFAGKLIQIVMPEVASKEANEVLLRAQELLKKTSEYILSQTEKL